ncbi:hypothetical protein B0H19DRAFT_1231808 [Mycena capillaripes]|nr:hypothetical protein B0H19DRAFT_1231808 [Mycena capillaripes]
MLGKRVSEPVPTLPPELWIYIHRLALLDISPFAKVSSRGQVIDYISLPDDPLNHRELQRFWEAARSLGCVCRLWSMLAQELLYENIWVTDERWPSLSLALEQPCIARRVRGMRLSFTDLDRSKLVLQRCGPSIEVLVVPKSLSASEETSPSLDPISLSLDHLLSLRQLHWMNWPAPLLHAILSAAPNLEHISISLPATNSNSELLAPLPSFPCLRYLRLTYPITQRMHVLLSPDMPQLVHLTIAPVHVASDGFPLLPALHTLVLTSPSSPTPFPAILRRCPALAELGYGAHLYPIPPEETQTAARLLCVRLSLSTQVFILKGRANVVVLLARAFTSLQHVVFHGSGWAGKHADWTECIELRARGCRVETGPSQHRRAKV